MNPTEPDTHFPNADALEARFARAVVASLSENAENIAPDIAERLRFARQRAVEKARAGRGTVHVVGAGSAAVAGLSGSAWWWRVGSALPLVALVAGLVFIQMHQSSSEISTAAEVDAALLGDDVPITAYRDAGFLEYLKTQPGE